MVPPFPHSACSLGNCGHGAGQSCWCCITFDVAAEFYLLSKARTNHFFHCMTWVETDHALRNRNIDVLSYDYILERHNCKRKGCVMRNHETMLVEHNKIIQCLGRTCTIFSNMSRNSYHAFENVPWWVFVQRHNRRAHITWRWSEAAPDTLSVPPVACLALGSVVHRPAKILFLPFTQPLLKHIV